jgi:hypothetical protein
MGSEIDKEFYIQIESVEDLIPRQELKLEDDVLICECFCVNVGDIRLFSTSPVELDQLRSRFSLGEGCKSCVKSFDSWKDKI